MQRYNPMTKCLETVKTTDSKKRRTMDGFSLYDLKNAHGENKKVQIMNKNHAEVFMGTVGEALKNKKFAGKSYKMLPEQHGVAKFVMLDRKTIDSKIKTVNASELKQGNTIVQTGEKIISVENIGDKVKIIAKRVLAGGATPSIYKVAPNTKIKITDKQTVDNDIALLINRIMKDAQKIQDVSKEMLRNKLAERIDERGRKNLNTMIVMLEKSIQELANISYRSYPFKDRKTVDAGYDSPSQMESKLKNFVNKAKTANSKQELEKINNDLFFYVAKLKSNALKKYGTTNNKFNSTEEWDKNYSKIASKYMNELQRLVDNFR